MRKAIVLFYLMLAVIGLTASATAQTSPADPAIIWQDVEQGGEKLFMRYPFAGMSNGALIIAGGKGVDLFHQDAFSSATRVYTQSAADQHWELALMGSLPQPAARGAVAGDGKSLYFAGGLNADGELDALLEVEWNAVQKQLELRILPSMPSARMGMGAAMLDGALYLAGGESNNPESAGATPLWKYDTAKGKWSELASWSGKPRISPVLLASDGALYLAGGIVPQPEQQNQPFARSAKAWCYFPRRNKWTALPDLPAPIGETFGFTDPGGRLYYYDFYKNPERNYFTLEPGAREWRPQHDAWRVAMERPPAYPLALLCANDGVIAPCKTSHGDLKIARIRPWEERASDSPSGASGGAFPLNIAILLVATIVLIVLLFFFGRPARNHRRRGA
ncbi:hypothetical protein JXA32_11005 [Candidatus Sumerlaeota bacterium]|nr:hypothetical protein [Candidatus Sumerlaeota bacterium]